MQSIIYIFLAIITGAIISIYLPMNSTVAKYFGSPITANVSFFLVSLLTATLIFFLFGDLKTIDNFTKVPPHLFMTGVISALMVLGTTFLIPKLGARKFFVLLLAGQVIMALIISHFGILESPTDPITWKKLAGAAILILGAIVSTV
jgi:bacterial/archaeal transporter family-2 protein